MSEKKCSSLTLMIVPARGNSWSELLTSALSSGLNQSFYTLLSRSIQCELDRVFSECEQSCTASSGSACQS
jgi:hypothetical protein